MKENSLNKKDKQQNAKRQFRFPPKTELKDQDEQKKRNFELIGKMFGNLSESINVNKVELKNNSDNKFSAGFKPNSILKNNKTALQQSSFKEQSNKKIDIFTVYDQFGLINESIDKRNSKSKGKPKYREDDPNQFGNKSVSNLYRAQQSDLFDQMKDNRRQQFQQTMQNNYVNLHEYYDIAKQKDRNQTVIHVKSSLDNMNLQNIQAKIQAHRRQLKNIQNQYKVKKGLKPEESSHQNEEAQKFQNFTKTGQNDIYKQYGKTQSQVYQMIKKNQKDDQKQIQIDQMWEQKLKQNPKLVQYSKKYQQYLVQKDAKNILFGTVRQNLFKWDKYTKSQNQKPKPQIKRSSVSKEKSLAKLNKSLQKFQQQKQLQHSTLKAKSINEVLASKDDKFIAKYIFTQVDVDKRGLLSKQQLLDFITKNQHIINSYNIDLKWIYTDLDNFDTKRKGMLNREQLGIFLATFQRIQHPQIKLKNITDESSKQHFLMKQQSLLTSKKQKQSPFQVLFAKDLYRFRNLFEKLDLNEDKILKREQYIENIFIDPDCSKIINGVVIKIKVIEKNVTYRQMISFILDDYRNQKNEKLKKSKQYITFNRFCQYFQFPESINIKLLDKKKTKKSDVPLTNQLQIIDIEAQNLIVLKDIFDTIPRVYQDFITTADFIQIALMDPQVLSFQQEICKIPSVQTQLPVQNVRQTLQRMIRESDQYIDWETAEAFFSRRGRPLQWNGDLINKKKIVRKEQREKSINQALKRELIQKNQFEISAKLKEQYKSKQKRSSQNNYTIPQPFKITDELKQKGKNKKIEEGQSQFKQLSKTFKAKPVNKLILESKPQLIQGKRGMSSSKKIPQYNYENYENDRIERVLKKVQQERQLEEQKQKIKEMANVKNHLSAMQKIAQLMKNEKKNNNKQQPKQKKQLTQIQKQIAERLHPDKDQQHKKQQKLKQKLKKAQQDKKNKKKLDKERLINNQQIIKKNLKQTEQLKNKKKQEDKKRKDGIPDQNLTLKPDIKPKSLTSQEQKAIEDARNKRQQEKQDKINQHIKQQQERRKKILAMQLKDPYLKIENLSEQQIIDKIYQINILDILIDDKQKEEFKKEHGICEKDKKSRQNYIKGVSTKFKIDMEKQENVLKQLKIKYKQEIQKNNIKTPQTSTITNIGPSQKMNRDLFFHGSKALRRYREIIQGVSHVNSEYDRYSQKNFDNSDKKINQIQEDALSISQNEA